MKNYSQRYYDSLNKSKLTPPGYVFSTVWPILYILLLYYLISIMTHKKCRNVRVCYPLIPFLIQLVLNFSWSPIFFRYRKIKIAWIINLAMIFFTLLTMYLNTQIDPKLNILLLPYILWISFAAYLNGYLVFYN